MIHTNFVGRLVEDPKLKKIEKEGKEILVCNANIAVNRLYSEKVDYIDATFWGKQAEALVENNSKGSRLAIDGKLETKIYDKEDGTKGKNYNVVVDTVQFLDRKKEKDEQQEITQEQELER